MLSSVVRFICFGQGGGMHKPILPHRSLLAPQPTNDRLQQPLLLPHLLKHHREPIPIHRPLDRRRQTFARASEDRTRRTEGVGFDEFLEDGGGGATDVDEGGGGGEDLDDFEDECVVEGRPAVVEVHEVLEGG